jgi:hypothetical protein
MPHAASSLKTTTHYTTTTLSHKCLCLQDAPRVFLCYKNTYARATTTAVYGFGAYKRKRGGSRVVSCGVWWPVVTRSNPL